MMRERNQRRGERRMSPQQDGCHGAGRQMHSSSRRMRQPDQPGGRSSQMGETDNF